MGAGVFITLALYTYREKMMKTTLLSVAVLFAALFTGCDNRTAVNGKSSLLGQKDISYYADLDTNAVIVSVDGRNLTKQEAERRLELTFALAKAAGNFSGDLKSPAVKALFLRRIPGQFISETLLLNAARGAGIIASRESVEYAQDDVLAAYGDEGVAFERFVAKIPKRLRDDLGQMIETGALIHEYLKSRADGLEVISESDIDGVVEFGRKQKALSEKTLVEQRLKAKEIYDRLVAGEDFSELARDSFTAADDNENGEWGEFTPAALESLHPGVVKALSGLGEGEIAKPLELEDGIYIIQLVKREGKGVESVFSSDPETLTLKRIVIPLPVLYEIGSRGEIRKGLLKERLSELQKNKLLPELRAKAHIEYPNGKIAFRENKTPTDKRR